jgi:hypothetical protein
MSHDAGRAMELSGWAEQYGMAAECILIVDGDHMVIGSGASVARRPDLERAKGRSLGLVGWKAVATLPKSTPICALALFPGADAWIPPLQLSSRSREPGPGRLPAPRARARRTWGAVIASMGRSGRGFPLSSLCRRPILGVPSRPSGFRSHLFIDRRHFQAIGRTLR